MKTQIVSLSLPHVLVKTADTFSKSRGISRSDLFRSAITRYLDGERWRSIQGKVRNQVKGRLVQSEADIERLVDSIRR